MGFFSSRNPFGLTEHEQLGMLRHEQYEEELYEAISLRGKPSARTGAFVGNGITNKRYRNAAIIAVLIFGAFFARAGWLQVVHGETFRALADANRIRTVVLPAARGVITDRYGVELARNTPSFTLVGHRALRAVPAANELPANESERNAVLLDAAREVSGDPLAFLSAYDAAAPGESFALMLDVPYERALAFSVHDDAVAGVDVVLGAKRSYVSDVIPTLSHVLGYTGVISEEEYAAQEREGYLRYDRIGKQGIEKEYEKELRGSFGKETIEVDSLGKYLRTIAKVDPVNGEPLTLSIDAELQAYVERAIVAKLEGQTPTRVAVVAMDPNNGEILALVSWPAYDANLFAQGIDSKTYAALLNDPSKPLFPRAYAGEYPSGSVIKPVYAAAALTEGIVTPTTSFVSTGGLQVGNRFFPDWRRNGGHGVTNVYHAIADSVNTYFYIIGGGYDTFQGLGVEKLMEWAAKLGFGTRSGLDMPTEGEGFLPSKAWKEAEKGEPWYIGDTYNVSIGQGDFLVTPVQVARSTAVFANGGMLVTPHLKVGLPANATRVVEESIATVVRDGMRQTVTAGSATSLQLVSVPVAGKTGTAQWSTTAPTHSWFTGFAPFENPSIVITVIVEESGSTSLAVPIARDILTWQFSRE